jgi:hypothetical protein
MIMILVGAAEKIAISPATENQAATPLRASPVKSIRIVANIV